MNAARLCAVICSLIVTVQSVYGGGSPWNTSLAVGFGFNSGGMKPLLAPDNPLVFKTRKDQLNNGLGFTANIFLEKIHWTPSRQGGARPDIGFRVGVGTSGIQQFYANETLDGYKFNYTRIPVEVMYCISSKDAYIRDDDEIDISGDRVTFHKGTGVIKTHSSVFLHGGVAFGSINSVTYSTSTFTGQYQDSFMAVRSNIHKKDPALIAGLEFRTSNVGFDVTYLKSMQSIYNNADVRNSIWTFTLKFIW